MKFIDEFPLPMLILGSLMLGLAPFFPEPHLFEKIRMLFSGNLSKPIDVFDLLMHGAMPALLSIKLVRLATLRNK